MLLASGVAVVSRVTGGLPGIKPEADFGFSLVSSFPRKGEERTCWERREGMREESDLERERKGILGEGSWKQKKKQLRKR